MSKNAPKQLKDGAKSLAKQEKEKSLAKEFTVDEVRNILKERLHFPCDPDYILEKSTKEFNAWLGAPTKKEADRIKGVMIDTHNEALIALGLETHYPLADMVGKRHRGLAIETARQLEKEYDCKTPSEKLLAQTIAGIYCKIVEFTPHLGTFTKDTHLDNDRNAFYSMVSKELDRAHRQLITALATLRQIKNPPMELNVKARNAFVAQNQQINAVNKPENNPADQ